MLVLIKSLKLCNKNVNIFLLLIGMSKNVFYNDEVYSMEI